MEKARKNKPNTSIRISIVIIGVLAALIILKAIAAWITGSVSLKSDALHSTIDLVGAIVGLISIRIANAPPDKDHPYGHGKAENIAGMLISVLIFAAGIFIAYEAISRLINGGQMENSGIGIIITIIGLGLLIGTSLFTLRVARRNKSVALEATAKDMLADVYGSIAVLVGLILVAITGWVQFDSIVALLVSLIIFHTAYGVFKSGITNLMDKSISEKQKKVLDETLTKYHHVCKNIHAVRTRESGNKLYADLHITVNCDAPLHEVHDLCTSIENDIKKNLGNSSIVIHPEPCDVTCERCRCECVKKTMQKNRLDKM